MWNGGKAVTISMANQASSIGMRLLPPAMIPFRSFEPPKYNVSCAVTLFLMQTILVPGLILVHLVTWE